MPSKTISLVAILAAGSLAAASVPAAAQTPEEFFKGKTITVLCRAIARRRLRHQRPAVAKHIGNYIPGDPTMIVKNMPGGGGLVMTNYVANVAERMVCISARRSAAFRSSRCSAIASHAKFDPMKLNWIGSANADTSVAVVTKRVRRQVLAGLEEQRGDRRRHRRRHRERDRALHAAQRARTSSIKVIAGYPGGSEMNLAMQRGEVDGRGTFSWTSLKPHKKDWIDSGD